MKHTSPLNALRYHVSGAIARGETDAVLEKLGANQPVILTRVETPYLDKSQLTETSKANRMRIARTIAKLLESLSAIHGFTSQCPMTTDCDELRYRIKKEVEAHGWLITTPDNKYRVTPPRPGRVWIRYGWRTAGKTQSANGSMQIPVAANQHEDTKIVFAMLKKKHGKNAILQGFAYVGTP